MEAFSIFISHWLLEETKAKKKVYFSNSRKALETFIRNRKIVSTLMSLEEQLLEFMFQEDEDFQNEHEEEIAELAMLCLFVAKKVGLSKEVLGICKSCGIGIVRFNIEEITSVKATCAHCKEVRFCFENVHIGPENLE